MQLNYRLVVLVFLFPALSWSQSLPPFGKSIEETSKALLGKVYCGDALGEGADGAFDQDPRCRMDAFDCQTFVETVIALSHSKDKKSFEEEMSRVRYAKMPEAYQNRLHFSETQWIPENEKHGFIQDVTDSTKSHEEIQVTVDAHAWYQAKTEKQLGVKNPSDSLLNVFRALGNDQQPETVDFSYVAVSNIDEKFLEKIPSPSIIMFVKLNSKPSIGATPIMVTHMGFVLNSPSGKIMRHAALNKEVLDINLKSYIDNFKKSPTAVGIKILKVL